MRLWTVQTIDVYNQVMSAGGYRVNPNHPDSCESQFDMFKEAYAWLHGKAAERGLADNGRGMIWAWYRFNGESRRKPDVRTLRKESTAGKELCCLTLEVPEDKVLLMDSDQWQCRLSGFACVTAEQEAMDSDEYIRWLDGLYAMPEADRRQYDASTWDLVFDTSRGGRTEAVFFGLERSMIKEVQFFTGAGWGEEE